MNSLVCLLVFAAVLSFPLGQTLNLADVPCGNSGKSWIPLRAAKIIGGVPTLPGEFPWIVSIKRLHDSHFCGGVIIDQRHVLSAAHCFHDFSMRTQSPSQMEVVVGEHDQDRRERPVNSVKLRVSSLTLHPDYQEKNKINDIAVLKLEEPIKWGRTVQPACFGHLDESHPSPPQYSGRLSPLNHPHHHHQHHHQEQQQRQKPQESGDESRGTVAGWGLTAISSTSLPNQLRKVDVAIWSNATCVHFLRTRIDQYDGSGKEQICAGNKLKDSCDGDSGGPLMTRHGDAIQVIGIVSGRLDDGCGKSEVPGLYTRVGSYFQWIREIIRS